MRKKLFLIAFVIIASLSSSFKLKAQDSYLWTMGITVGSYYNVADYYDNNVLSPWPYTHFYPVPILLDATEWKMLEATGTSSYSGGIKQDGTLWVWANNGSPERAPEPTQLGTDNDWKLIAFTNNGRYALKEDGSLWNLLTSTRIGEEDNWVSISGATDKAVGLREDGTIWYWTNNAAGTYENNMVQIATDATWKFVSSSGGGICGIKTDGTLWRFPNNVMNAPTQEGTDNDWKAAYGGPTRMHAIKENGTIWSRANNNSSGMLGLGEEVSNAYELTQIGTATDWKKISVGGAHVYALKEDGTLFGWGDNEYRQLGDGTTTDRYAPVQIGEEGEWYDIVAGVNHGVALRNYGYGSLDSNTGTNVKEEHQKRLLLYPNPAKQYITIDIAQQVSKVSIYNSIGELISTTRDQRIDVSFLAEGVYILRIEAGYEVFLERLVVQK